MSKTESVETVVRDVVTKFVSQNVAFNLETVLSQVKNFATDDVEKAMLKSYFVGLVGPNPTISNYVTHTFGGKIAFAPESMNEKEVENTLKPKTVKSVKNTSNMKVSVSKQLNLPNTKSVRMNYVSDFYSPDKRGRIRVPAKMTFQLGMEPSALAFVEVKEDNTVVVHRDVSKKKNFKSYTIDRYGNLLFPVNEPTKNYRLSVVRGRVVARPIQA